MQTIEGITIYRCDYCKNPKKYFLKSACIKHEQRCHYNPNNNRACQDCIFLVRDEAEVYIDDYFDDDEYSEKRNVFGCLKHRKPLHLPKTTIKGNQYRFVNGKVSEEMPRKCGDHNNDILNRSEEVDKLNLPDNLKNLKQAY